MINENYLNIIVDTFTKSISNPPTNNPTASDMTITATVNLTVSCLVGHVTFLSSEATSEKNFVGATVGNLGTFGRSILFS